MTLKDSLTLRHTKYLALGQVWAALCLAILAGDYFNLWEVRTTLFQVILINNILLALFLGVLGLYFFGSRLKGIELRVAHHVFLGTR